MKHKELFLLLAVITLLYMGCNVPHDIPEGEWQSLQGRPSLTLKKDSIGKYKVIVHHKMANGRTCPISYPIIQNATGMYIQAEGRILICYSFKDSILFLSPGGRFHLKK